MPARENRGQWSVQSSRHGFTRSYARPVGFAQKWSGSGDFGWKAVLFSSGGVEKAQFTNESWFSLIAICIDSQMSKVICQYTVMAKIIRSLVFPSAKNGFKKVISIFCCSVSVVNISFLYFQTLIIQWDLCKIMGSVKYFWVIRKLIVNRKNWFLESGLFIL